MSSEWFTRRRYKHFDVPVGAAFAGQVTHAAFVSRHSFSPLISYQKLEKRYRAREKKTVLKRRDIMYASHRDACILDYYSFQLLRSLEEEYAARGICSNPIAYRALRKANYHFSADALRFAMENTPCMVLAFDVSGFFDNLDHALLKSRLKSLLHVSELPDDWFKVLRFVTRFSHIARPDIEAHPVLGPKISDRSRHMVAPIAEVVQAGIPIHRNIAGRGIPQGTPISSALANLYMVDFDQRLAAECSQVSAFYRRYSDDILLICKDVDAARLEAFVEAEIRAEKLSLNAAKTERTTFDGTMKSGAQYLGFRLSSRGATIRENSLGRQWRKLKRTAKRIERQGRTAIALGRADKIYTRKLRKRFAAMPPLVRNFSAYARRSADALEAPEIKRQVRRLERALDTIIKSYRVGPTAP